MEVSLKTNKLHENQLKLIRHLAQFPVLDYESCLRILDTEGTGNKLAMSYAFRPLTRNNYIGKDFEGYVTILSKGRALFPELTPLISAGGIATRQRAAQVSRMAMRMEEIGIPCCGERQENMDRYFIPSACWRRIAPGILSTTRFVGMLIMGKQRYAVYDIGNGQMDWQIRAESSLFYYKYGNHETRAHGMILVCEDGKRNKIAENIIRQTMWNRKQLLRDDYTERTKPTLWSSSPIRLRAQYMHVYLSTQRELRESLRLIRFEKDIIAKDSKGSTALNDPSQGDYEIARTRCFANPASDLLKYVYFFSAVKTHIMMLEHSEYYTNNLTYKLIITEKDGPLMNLYQDVGNAGCVKIYVYNLGAYNLAD